MGVHGVKLDAFFELTSLTRIIQFAKPNILLIKRSFKKVSEKKLVAETCQTRIFPRHCTRFHTFDSKKQLK